jgi:hypothetical protein
MLNARPHCWTPRPTLRVLSILRSTSRVMPASPKYLRQIAAAARSDSPKTGRSGKHPLNLATVRTGLDA